MDLTKKTNEAERTRSDAYALMTEWTVSHALRAHMLAVEAAMRGAARRAGEDVELWGMTGLLHDFDYERFPNVPEHPLKGSDVLREEGYPNALIEAILGHVEETGVARETALAKTLFAVDELCGFLIAVAQVRPSRKLAEVEVSSVKKKLKDKGFARAVSRDDITQGAADLGVELDTHIENVLGDLQAVAESLGV